MRLNGIPPCPPVRAIRDYQACHLSRFMRIQPILRTLPLLSLMLSSSLLWAEIQRKTLSTKGDWTIIACTENGKPAGAEMRRTYDGKHEFHLRIHTDDSGVYLDSTKDWSSVSESKTQAAELRVNSVEGDPVWAGSAKVITDPDGLPWLRLPLGKSAEGDVTERVLTSIMDGGKKLYFSVGKDTEWEFDFKGGKAAYDVMFNHIQNGSDAKTAAAAPAATSPPKKSEPVGRTPESVEHEYARPGDWAVHYYTSRQNKWVSSSMIRFFDNGSMLRMSIDKARFNIDLAGDWKAPETAEGKKGNSVPVYIVLDEKDDGNGLNETATIINDEGDKWLRLSQPLDEPSGLQDIVRNAKKMHVIFSTEAKWTSDLKGSNAAWQKVEETVGKTYKE